MKYLKDSGDKDKVEKALKGTISLGIWFDQSDITISIIELYKHYELPIPNAEDFDITSPPISRSSIEQAKTLLDTAIALYNLDQKESTSLKNNLTLEEQRKYLPSIKQRDEEVEQAFCSAVRSSCLYTSFRVYTSTLCLYPAERTCYPCFEGSWG